MEINFLNNGIDFIYSNNRKLFIAYQAIVKISDVYIGIDDSEYDWMLDRYFGEKIGKYAYLEIYLSNKQKINVILDDSYKWFRRYDKNEVAKLSFWKRIFMQDLSKEGLDNKAKEWLENKSMDMYEPVAKTKELREKIIENFNNWKQI